MCVKRIISPDEIASPTFYGTRFFFLTKFVKSMPPLNKMLYKLLLNPIHPHDIKPYIQFVLVKDERNDGLLVALSYASNPIGLSNKCTAKYEGDRRCA